MSPLELFFFSEEKVIFALLMASMYRFVAAGDTNGTGWLTASEWRYIKSLPHGRPSFNEYQRLCVGIVIPQSHRPTSAIRVKLRSLGQAGRKVKILVFYRVLHSGVITHYPLIVQLITYLVTSRVQKFVLSFYQIPKYTAGFQGDHSLGFDEKATLSSIFPPLCPIPYELLANVCLVCHPYRAVRHRQLSETWLTRSHLSQAYISTQFNITNLMYPGNSH